MGPRRKFSIEEFMYKDRNDLTLDWERVEGPDQRDPRFLGSCSGDHKVVDKKGRTANTSKTLSGCLTNASRRCAGQVSSLSEYSTVKNTVDVASIARQSGDAQLLQLTTSTPSHGTGSPSSPSIHNPVAGLGQ